ncbi:hypothetical protein RSAG8_04022, partial [Rhizoctonia solani AG-8 WAC10335]
MRLSVQTGTRCYHKQTLTEAIHKPSYTSTPVNSLAVILNLGLRC